MTDDAQMKIRLPAALKTSIEEAANAANRSWNGEIVSRLEASFASTDSDARSKLAAQRILDIDLTTGGSGLASRVTSLESELDALRAEVRRLARKSTA